MISVKDRQPPPHALYLVLRNNKYFTCTVCYGMHAPWWIVHTMKNEADPIDMLDTDLWCPLEDLLKLVKS